ncbi:hypothetical protein ACRALDRAFT_2044084 [Sodiomyces alcalophilus JCM 7366]|uniref:uncharacterized protein n=1 Tax=Sodiomyces alcalophilus JCM 7366 TaxID=591952 RepID=UPI0039B65C2F
MGENDEKQTGPAIPAWQRVNDQETPEQTPQETPEKTPEKTPEETPEQMPEQTPEQTSERTPEETPEETPEQTPEETPEETPSPAEDTTTMDVARRFLQDDHIKNTNREHKADFLRTKGLPDEDIEKLLDEVEASHQDQPDPPEPTPKTIPDPPPEQRDDSPSTPSTPSTPQSDEPPVITYPEFLAKPPRNPPLVTATGVLNTLYAFAGLSTLLYGTSKFLVGPMVENLTEARTDFHETTSRKLDSLVTLLERTVSEIPPTVSAGGSGNSAKGAARHDADSDEADDPTELFHRDIGVQTSLPPSPRLAENIYPSATGGDSSSKPPAAQHARKIEDLVASLRGVKDAYVSQTEDLADVKTALSALKDDMAQITYAGGQADFVGSYSLYNSYGSRRPEPEDEIKKARDNIRRVKGVMLSTRSFPLSTR